MNSKLSSLKLHILEVLYSQIINKYLIRNNIKVI